MKKAKHDWSSHIEAIKTQGTSARAFAKRHNVSLSAPPVHTKAEPLAATKQSNKFVALRIDEAQRASPPAPTHCTLVLAGGMRLEMPALPSPQWLADLSRCTQGAR